MCFARRSISTSGAGMWLCHHLRHRRISCAHNRIIPRWRACRARERINPRCDSCLRSTLPRRLLSQQRLLQPRPVPAQWFLVRKSPNLSANILRAASQPKQFQRALRQQEDQARLTAGRQEAATPTPVQPAPIRPPAAAPVNTPDQAAISDVERKADELIRLKEAREQQKTNVAPAAVSQGPKTKRQRLDDLLRQFIDGKLTDAEYQERREKIISEREPK